MRLNRWHSRFFVLALAALTLPQGSGALGCGADPREPAADRLRAQFPDQAGLVLRGAGAFVQAAEGLCPARSGSNATNASDASKTSRDRGVPLDAACDPESAPAERRNLVAVLPLRGDDAVRLRLPGGFEAQVRERGAHGEADTSEAAVAYARPYGASFWAATESGFEEWLLLEGGAANSAGEPAAIWDIEGATLQQRGDAVDLLDADGTARITVTAPAAFAIGGRPVQAKLQVRGASITLSVDAQGEPVLVDPLWTATAPLIAARYAHAAALLPNGKVLVSGGVDNVALQSAELYDPAAGTWSQAGVMTSARRDHTATLLPNGKVLVTGGYKGGNFLATTEIYTPAMNTWAAAAPMLSTHYGHTATLLPNGKVLVAGGGGTNSTGSEIYDPVFNSWAATPSLGVGRSYHTATLLPNGKVLVVGGCCSSGASVEIYDPAANTWTAAASLKQGRYFHTATLLQDGRVLVAGGNGPAAATSELYNPAQNTWTVGPMLSAARTLPSATLLQSGKVLLAGGQILSSTETYDPATNAWSPDGTMLTARYWHSATLLQDGRVLIAGGYNGNSTKNAEIYGSLVGAACSAPGECLSGFCADGVCCSTACGAGPCDACSIAAGAAQNGTCTPLSGAPCSDGNACSTGDFCQAGVCLGSGTVVCAASDACHEPGTCDPATGACSTPSKPDGSPCDDGSACTTMDTCQAGTCAGGSPVLCPATDTCHEPGACDPATGLCSNPALPDGSPCDDGDKCSKSDVCQAGVCGAGTPVVCAAIDACHEPGTCDPMTGACSAPAKPDGSPCDDGDKCTEADACEDGACQSGSPVVCAPSDQCHSAGLCNPATGACSNPKLPDGTACDDGSACTQADTCKAGACLGVDPIKCPSIDECREDGACDPATGACSAGDVKPDGTACSGGVCKAGMCSGGSGSATSSSASTTGGGEGGASGSVSAGSVGGGTEGSYSEGNCGCRVAEPAPKPWPWAALLGLLALRRTSRKGTRARARTSL
jgi:MYXO-CTERM domain-containing protein